MGGVKIMINPNDILIALDDGHSPDTAGKRTPPIPELNNRVIRENEFNKAVKLKLDKELQRCGFRTILVAKGDKDVPLQTRVKRANDANADAYVSIHYNALDGEFDGNDPEGLSIHIHKGSVRGRELAEAVLKHLKTGTPQKNRGIVESNFHVLRETKMVAILTENGFMDHKREAMLMIDDNFQTEVAREHAMGLCDYFKVPYIPESNKVETPKPSTPTKPTQSTTVLKIGSKGDAVKLLQADLIKLGLVFAGGVDGSFGYGTQSAVKAFQKRYGLVIDGIAGPLTQAKIASEIKLVPNFKHYVVRVNVSALNVRDLPSKKAKVNTVVYGGNAFTIVEEKDGWGKLKSGAGWISLEFCSKVR